MIVLGIETSCDETAAAIVADEGSRGRILSNLVLAQLDLHRPYGGVVPEIAARAHLGGLDRLIAQALREARLSLAEIDAVAAAAGPGLIGGLVVGTTMGKALAWAAGKAFLAVNHLEAHALSVRLCAALDFPYLLLLVSGGHSQLLICAGVGRYTRLGTTLDDAAGEAFDKTAKLLGLGYPGGPAIERAARGGDPRRFPLPRPMRGRPCCDFSFSGLKTAVREVVGKVGPFGAREEADLAASIELAICETLAERTERAIRLFRRRHPEGRALVACGGVAANGSLRLRLSALALHSGLEFLAPAPDLCTDNAAMIAWAGLERLRLGFVDALDIAPRPRWPLDEGLPERRHEVEA